MDKKDTALLARDLMTAFRNLQRLSAGNCAMGWSEGKKAICHVLLDRNGGVSPGFLAKALEVGSGRIGTALGDLAKEGLVTRAVDPKDRRRTIVALTDRGRTEALARRAQAFADFETVVDTMGPERLRLLIELLDEFTRNGRLFAKGRQER